LFLCISAIVLAGLLVLLLFDPARHALYPMCVFKKVTGYDCPGCGGLRAMHHLLRGDIVGAFQLNAMAMVALPLTLAWLVFYWRRRGQRQPLTGRKALWIVWAIALVLVLFGIVRNLPFWPFGITAG
jgi:hypothetical protein